MNTEVVKIAGAFLAGIGVGGTVLYFVMKRRYEKFESAEDLGVHVKNDENDKNDNNDWAHLEEGEEVEPLNLSNGSYTERVNQMKEEYTKYGSIAKKYTGEEPEEKQVDELELKNNDDVPEDDIYVINADQWAHEKFGYDKLTLYFWEQERILTEEDGDILDVPGIIGYNWEQHMGEFEPDIVYVRNNNLETDYEVILRHDSYYEMGDTM